MSSPAGTSSSAACTRHFLIAAGVVFASFALPVVIIWWQVHAVFSGRSGRPSNMSKFYQGSVRDGELWFSAIEFTSNELIYDQRIWRLNLETGVEHPTEFVLHNENGYPIWLRDKFYVVSQDAIYEMIGPKLERLVNRPVHSRDFHTVIFLYENRLTMIAETASGGFRLVHLENGRWSDGREIVLPGAVRTWYDDARCQCKKLLPLSSEQPLSKVRKPRVIISVEEDAGQFHLFQTNLENFSAYRQGFEFADESFTIASAIAPANATREAKGWEPIQPDGSDQSWMRMLRTPQGLLFTCNRGRARIVRRDKNGRWQTLVESKDTHRPNLVGDPGGSQVYAINENQRWNAVNIHRVEGNSILPAHIQLLGSRLEYVTRWQRLVAGILIAWLFHYGILVAGTSWLQSTRRPTEYEFGDQRVLLASIFQRSIALFIDVLLFSPILFVPIYLHLQGFGYVGKAMTLTEWSDFLFGLESNLRSQAGSVAFPATWAGMASWARAMAPSAEASTLIIAIVSGALALFTVKVLVESWFGATPGKWLLGLRSVNLSLRQCGLFAVLLRNVMYWFDIPIFLTPIPGIISVMSSACNQRLGDRAARTVVIRSALKRNCQ